MLHTYHLMSLLPDENYFLMKKGSKRDTSGKAFGSWVSSLLYSTTFWQRREQHHFAPEGQNQSISGWYCNIQIYSKWKKDLRFAKRLKRTKGHTTKSLLTTTRAWASLSSPKTTMYCQQLLVHTSTNRTAHIFFFFLYKCDLLPAFSINNVSQEWFHFNTHKSVLFF